jgi:hypothetical protein
MSQRVETDTSETRAELREQIRRLRAALAAAPARWVIQHHGYDAWILGVRDPVLKETEGAPHARQV